MAEQVDPSVDPLASVSPVAPASAVTTSIQPPVVMKRSLRQIGIIVDGVLKQYGYEGEIPVPVEVIAEDIGGLNLIPIPNLMRDAHTQGYLSNDLQEISFDADLMDNEQRYSYLIAHEFGHLILHREYIQQHVPADISQWKSYLRSIAPGVIEIFEMEAHDFARLLLVPSDPLKTESDQVVAEVLSRVPSINLRAMGDTGREGVARGLVSRFKVSEANLIARLRQEELP